MGRDPQLVRSSFRARRSIAVSAFVALSLLALAAAPTPQAAPAVRLRLQWHGDRPHAWAGIFETSQGTIGRPATLGTAAGDAGTLWTDGKSAWLQRHTARIEDGFDATVIAPASARLSFTLQPTAAGARPQRFEWSLAELGHGPKRFATSGAVRSLTVQRAPGDLLRVHIDRPHLIYGLGERFRATVFCDPLAPNTGSSAGKLEWEINPPPAANPSRGTIGVYPRRDGVRPDGIGVDFALPDREGACELRFRYVADGAGAQQSTVQVMVLCDSPPESAGVDSPPATTVVDHFRPADGDPKRPALRAIGLPPAILQQVPTTNLGDADRASRESDALGPPFQWSAFRLHVKNPQRLHRLIVRVTKDPVALVGFSVLEPDAVGKLVPSTLNTAIAADTDATPAQEVSAPIRHDVVFWPRTVEPILFVHDLGTGRAPAVLDVELQELNERPASAPAADMRKSDERWIGPYLAKPLLAENFSAPLALDGPTRASLDDWTTFHVAALRAASLLRSNGYNSLLLGVLADGSTIYPSKFLESTPRYDSGILFSTGQDPMRKDVLELVHRVFDRERLVLVPELQFSTPLPSLERTLASDAKDTEGIELVGRDGRTWREVHAAATHGAYYNPLDRRVQAAVTAVVRELVERYSQHASFEGVAVEISADGFLELPGLEWGLDDTTIAKFTRDTGRTIDVNGASAERYERRYEILTGEARSEWIRWRCREMADFYRRLAALVASVNARSRLILAARDVLPQSADMEPVQHEVRTRGRLSELLPEYGLDFSLLQNVPRLALLRGARWRVSSDPEDALLDECVNYNRSLDAAFHATETGVLTYRPPLEGRPAEPNARSMQRENELKLMLHPVPAARAARRQFVRAVAANDAHMMFDGGWMVPLGRERQTAALRQTLRAIPRIPFYRVEIDGEPAVIRVARRDHKTYLYAANEFAQPIDVKIELSCPPGTPCHPLGASRPAAIESAGETAVLQTALEAYGLAAWVIDHEDVRVDGVRADMSAAATAVLDWQIKTFERRLADLRRVLQAETEPALVTAPERVDKAETDARGREVPVSGAAYWSIVGGPPGAERDAMRLVAGHNENVAVVSRIPETPASHLLVKLRLRGDRDESPARLTIESTHHGMAVERQQQVVAQTAWKSYEIRVEDWPAQCVANARLRVEALGSAKVWVDDVRFIAEPLSPDDLRQLAKISVEIALAREERRFAECARLLDGYWGRRLLLETRRSACKPVLREAQAPSLSPPR